MYTVTKMMSDAHRFASFTKDRDDAIAEAIAALKPANEVEEQDIVDGVHLIYNQAGWEMTSNRRTTEEIYNRLDNLGRNQWKQNGHN